MDRPYCSSDLFRQLIMDNASATEAECRTGLREKVHKCTHEVCPQCISPCNFPVARTVAQIFRCTDMVKHYGFLWYYQVSDAGQLARSMHGARRKDAYAAVPERLAAHLYHIGHYNPNGYVQRDSISCRREHATSPSAHFSPGFDETGMPMARQGFMVACKKHTDCYACGRHPLSGQQYKCQKRYVLYDTVHTDDDGELTFLNLTEGNANAFDIDLEDGAATGKTGICVDIDSSYNEGCSSQAGAAVKDGLIGCMDGFVSKFLCGLTVEVLHGDLSTVRTSGNLFYPRVLLNGAMDHDGDGEAEPVMQCYDPIGEYRLERGTLTPNTQMLSRKGASFILSEQNSFLPTDCSQKCLILERTARHGAGAPPSCAL